ncbi:MAG: hypothetical protein IKF05_01685 [Erysipelotrichaceae bacterium]|nr:hypothetical protein [Erysipelotrichaceae bacterium]
MINVLYAKQSEDRSGEFLTVDNILPLFSDAAGMLQEMEEKGKRVAWFFIDPLIDHFEAGNRFYFEVMGCKSLPKINYYRTGAGPIHALADAKLYIENGLCDAVAIFAYEPLYMCKKKLGGAAIRKAMDIFDGVNLISCYNRLAEQLCQELGIQTEEFKKISDALYDNYIRTYSALYGENSFSRDRGRMLEDMGGYLFHLTDCANPNVDFAGGMILCNDETYRAFNKEETHVVLDSAACKMVYGNPNKTAAITENGEILPHLRKISEALEKESGIRMKEELDKDDLLLAAYTCYPTSPFGLLFACDLVRSVEEIYPFLERHEITVEGGMSLGRAPWNCSAFRNAILIAQKLSASSQHYGLVHGNGGMGETQGLALFKRI